MTDLEEQIQEARNVHADLAYSLGVYFGYPHCCRLQFFREIAQGKDPRQRDINGSGFIPCNKHYKQIKSGKTTLDSLIKDRICPTPF